jgi:hypothetical protein
MMSEEKRTLKVIEAEYNKKAKEYIRVKDKLDKELRALSDEYKELKIKLTPVRIEIPINMESDGNE